MRIGGVEVQNRAKLRYASFITNISSLHRWIDLASILLISCVAIWVGAANVHFVYDDAFITYRYAHNFATGQGFVYNPGERILGTTTPLYAFVLGLLGLLNPESIPAISGYICLISLLVAGVGLYIFGLLQQQRLAGLLAGILYVTSPFLPITFGGEMLFLVALLTWSFVFYLRGNRKTAAVLLGLAVLTRFDAIIAAGVVAIHTVMARRAIPWRELGYFAAVIAPALIASRLYYGAFLPSTLGAKLAQRDSGRWLGFTHGAFEWISGVFVQGSSVFNLVAAPHVLRFIPFIALGMIAVIWRFRPWMLPLGWVAGYVLGYHLLNVPFYGWYIVPIAYGLALLAALGLAGIAAVVNQILQRWLQPRTAIIANAVVSVGLLLILMPGIIELIKYDQSYDTYSAKAPQRIYTRVGQWLNEHTPADASVGYLEIGYVGYYSQRRVIDALGLVNPDVAPAVARSEFTWAYEHYRPDYIIDNPRFADFVGSLHQAPWFQQEYREVIRMSEPRWDTLIVYQRQK